MASNSLPMLEVRGLLIPAAMAEQRSSMSPVGIPVRAAGSRFMKSVSIGDIKIGTENIEDDERAEGINVSWIEIILNKGSDEDVAAE